MFGARTRRRVVGAALGWVALALAAPVAAAEPSGPGQPPPYDPGSVAISIRVHPKAEPPPESGAGAHPEPAPAAAETGAGPKAAAAAAAADPGQASRGPATAARGDLILNVSRGQTLRLNRPATSIFIADPTIADIQAPSNQVVFVFGKKPGRTSLFALDAAGDPVAEYGVAVTQPIEELRTLLRNEIGDYRISVTYTPGGAALSGSLPNAALVESAKAITAQFLGQGATVTNRLRVTGALQVNLQVRVAEVRRSVLKEFGININANTRAGPAGFTVVSGGRVGMAQTTGRTNSVGVSYSDGVNSVSATLDALAEAGLVSILAEPNLTAISGEKASFVAGGEFPIPIAQALGQTSIQFRRFGASLEFQPTVLSNNLINIHVRPEVSELTAANGVAMNGVNVPGLTTRSADTVVELASGQSFAIGGLIRKNFTTNIGSMPGLGDIPILGALFRSSAFQKEETELVIIVTPYIVRATASPQSLDAPTDRIAPPTDAGRVLLNAQTKAPSGRRAPRKGSVGLTGDAGLGVE
ncbi:type II and III secretion system protein family protein [Methylobacterium sp. J-076]|uniref:type II and III secretion system protein family protein n=1 Tax=Methylobacterium sp. J-076 TaxID=2836655 RepID=UPI001FBA35FB|nr:type II and III secretion system protein family protein [Methylobacterium sp. J-076]MCJ2013114.1 type II and III secretion system protein family protein [Methylobacterium sp. J-076]